MKNRKLLPLITVLLALVLVFGLAATASAAITSDWISDVYGDLDVETYAEYVSEASIRVSGEVDVLDIDFTGDYADLFANLLNADGTPARNALNMGYGAYVYASIDMDAILALIEGNDITVWQRNDTFPYLYNRDWDTASLAKYKNTDETILGKIKLKYYGEGTFDPGDTLSFLLGDNQIGEPYPTRIDFYEGEVTADGLAGATPFFTLYITNEIEFNYHPGNNSFFSTFGNVNINPLNDAFLDLDALIDFDTYITPFPKLNVELSGNIDLNNPPAISDTAVAVDFQAAGNPILDASGYPLTSVMDGRFTIASIDLFDLMEDYSPALTVYDDYEIAVVQFNPFLDMAYPGHFPDNMKVSVIPRDVLQEGDKFNFIVGDQELVGDADILFMFFFLEDSTDRDAFMTAINNSNDLDDLLDAIFDGDADSVLLDGQQTFIPIIIENNINFYSYSDSGKPGNPIAFGEKTEPVVDTLPAYINGYPDGTFRANNPITRAEAAKIFTIAGGLTPATGTTPSFSDVKLTDWFAPYVVAAANASLVEGYPDGAFLPEGWITRAEFVAMVCRLAKADTSNTAAPYADIAENWAIGYINAAYAAGWLTDFTGENFNPDQAITRAEAVLILNLATGRYDLTIHQAGPRFLDVAASSDIAKAVEYASSVMVAPKAK